MEVCENSALLAGDSQHVDALDIQLKEMVDDGLVSKTIYPELPPRSAYRITELGKSLLPIIDMMLEWGQEYIGLFEKKFGKSNDQALS